MPYSIKHSFGFYRIRLRRLGMGISFFKPILTRLFLEISMLNGNTGDISSISDERFAAYLRRKTRKIPITTITEPKTFLAVTLSRSKTTAANVEKSGVVEEIGTAWGSGILVKL
jgi:hypothetical protein